MKKLFITLTALFALSMGAWAESSQREGAMNIEGILLWKMPANGGTMTIYGDEYQPMRNYTSADDNLRHFAGPEVESIDMTRGFNIGSFAFCELENLESVTLHGSSSSQLPIYCIGESAFAGSSKLASINSEILTDLRYIGTNAFAGTAIKTFTIRKPVGDELTHYAKQENGFLYDLNREHCYIATNAFADCKYLSTVYMKDDTPFAETYNGFLNDHAYLVVNNAEAAATYRAAWPEIANRIIYLEESITFENETFKDICISHWDTDGDGELSYEEAFAVTSFGDAFKGNTELKGITLNDLMPFVNVTTYESGVFEGCTSLEKITIPPYVTDIADDAFTGCTSLKEIHFVNKTPQMEDFTIVTNERTHIIVPDAYLPTYDAQWANKSELIIGESHIPFQCAETKKICVNKWDTNKDGELSYEEAANVKDSGRDDNLRFINSKITSFDELKFFTGVTGIPQKAFYGCSSLTSITIPKNVSFINNDAFYGCVSLRKLIIDDGTKRLELSANNSTSSTKTPMFSDCPLEIVHIGRDQFVGIINNTVLANNPPIQRVSFGDHITSIPSNLFYGWQNLTEVNLPNNITSIGNYAFYGCSGISSVTIPESVTSIGNHAFYGCSSLTSITLPNNIISIETYAFSGCSGISSVTIPESVTSIGNYAFQDCSSLASFNIPENSQLTSIGNYAFQNCSSLASFNIPEGVTSIGSNAFNNMPTVIFNAMNPSPATYNSFSSTAIFIVPDDAVEAYRTAWSSVAHRITSKSALEWKEVTCEAQSVGSHLAELIGEGNELDVVKLRISGTINSYDMMVMRNKMQNLRELDLTDATIVTNSYDYGTGTSTNNVFPDFMKGKNLTNILLPTSITSIGANALNGCKYIKEITIPDNVTTISSSAFSSCSLLSSINVSANSKLQTIGSSAFLSTTSLKNVNFSKATLLESIGNNAFDDSAITSISLPASLKTIGNSAFLNCRSLLSLSTAANIGNYVFKGCSTLQNVTIQEGATSIGQYAFQGLTALKTVTIENGLTTINKNAFDGCTALQSISLPESLNSIATYAFNGCTALKEITLPDALTSLGTYAFYGCTALEKAEIGMGITSVPQYLFSGCTALKDVKMSPKTTTIQSYAFQNCTGLTEVHLPPYLTTIQSNAFSGCSNLKEIYAYMPDVPTIAASTFSNYLTSTLYAPAFLFDAYYYDSGWNQFLYVKRCDLRPGDFEAFYTNKDLLFKEGEERITADRPIVELGAKGSIIVEGANQEFTTVDMLRGASTSSSLIGDDNIPMDELRVKVEVSANRWYFLCFPYDVNISECTYPGKYAWRYYDGATRAANGTGGWQKIEGDVLKAGVGYIFQSNTAGNLIVKFAKPKFGGDRPTTLTAYSSTNAANASWNFVGNPYASYYNVEAEDFTSPITVWNGSTYVAYRPGDDDYHLQPYEAFFVQKTEDASAVNFDADRRETYTMSKAVAASQARVRRERGITPERLIVNLTISDNDTAAIDRTRLVMNAKASRSYEMACDASKFISDDAAAQLYTLEGNVKMAINERPGDGEVRLGYIATKAGTLRLEAQRMDMPMEIIDTETDRTFDLSQGAYEFTTKAGTFDNRFVVRASRAATEIMNLTAATGVAIGMQEGGLSIGGATDKQVSIYTANGALVAEQYGNGFVALASGTYVVKVDGHSAKMYVK